MMIRWLILILLEFGCYFSIGAEIPNAPEKPSATSVVQTNDLSGGALLLAPPPLKLGTNEPKKTVKSNVQRGATAINNIRPNKSTNIAAKSTNIVSKSTNIISKLTNVISAGVTKNATNMVEPRKTNEVAVVTQPVAPFIITNIIAPTLFLGSTNATASEAEVGQNPKNEELSQQIKTVAPAEPAETNKTVALSEPVITGKVIVPVELNANSKHDEVSKTNKVVANTPPSRQTKRPVQAKAATPAEPTKSAKLIQVSTNKIESPIRSEPKKPSSVAQKSQPDNHDNPPLLSNSHSGDSAEGHNASESDSFSDETNKIRLELEGPASPNLLNPSNHISEDRLFEVQLVLAQKLRLEKNNVQAIKTMISLLESKAPDVIKKTTMLELAQIYQENNELLRAQQIYSQFCQRYPQDPRLPVIFLKLGILYREMGSPNLAIGKFYSVMTTAINLRTDHFEEYRRLVLHAQTEIADTYYYQGKYPEATDLFKRLLKEETPLLNRPLVQFKLLRSLYNQRNFVELQAFGQDFLNRFPTSPDQPEVRFLLATALKQLGNNKESLEQVLLLLQSQSQIANVNPATWSYWQQRTGNEIANQLYQEADYHNALEIYQGLAKLDSSAKWQIPVLYQIGLVYERLNQAPKAVEIYQQILKREKELRNPPPSNMKSIVDMARWRTNYLGWTIKVEGSQQSVLSLPGARNLSTNIP